MGTIAKVRRTILVLTLLGLPMALALYYVQGVLDFSQIMLLTAVSLGLAVGNLLDHQSTLRRICNNRIETAREEIEAGHLVVARGLLDQVDRLDKRNFEARVARGELYRAEQNFDKARRQLLEALELKPESYRAHYALAVTYLQEKKIYEAISEFNATLRLNEDFAEAHYLLAQAQELMGEKEKAVHSYKLFDKMVNRQGDGASERLNKYQRIAQERLKALT